MILKLRRGSFSGRLIILAAFGMMVYSFLNQAMNIAIEVLGGESYQFNVGQIIADGSEPLAWLAVLWLTMTIVRGLQDRQASGERYWGI